MASPKTLSPNSFRETAPPFLAKPTGPEFSWVEIANHEQLNDLIPDWDDLAAHATEPNPFYESWNLRRALETFDPRAQVIVIWRRGPSPGDSRQLCGLFPFEATPTFRGLPVRAVRMWHHLLCFLCTPLVRKDSEALTLRTLFDWLDASGIGVLELPLMHGCGPFSRALIDATNLAGLLMWTPDQINRASIEVAPNTHGETYLAATITGKARQEWQRQRRRLAAHGRLETRVLGADDDVREWIGWFLDLEASGWKGREQTALACSSATAQFFSAVAREAFSRQQFRMLGLFLNGAPIALKCDLLSGRGGFGFKMAFDERYAKYSPGVQLELDNVVDLHRQQLIQWVDSCTEPDSAISRLWKGRRSLHHVLISSGSRRGDLAVGMVPLIRSLRRALRSVRTR